MKNKRNLNSQNDNTFKVSEINSSIFEKNLAADTFGSGTGKEGAGLDNMTAVTVFFKHEEDNETNE